MTDHNVREALSKALSDLDEAHGATAPVQRSSRRTTIVAAPEPVADPRYREYGAEMLAAAKADYIPVSFDGFLAWRRIHPELDGHGVGTHIRLWRQHLAALEAVANLG